MLVRGSRLCRFFVVDAKFAERMEKMNSRIRTKKSVADMRRLQGLLEESGTQGTLKEKLVTSAAKDDGFETFLRQFREKNKEYSNIIDLSRFYNQNNQLNQEEQLRKDELLMLEEFRKRSEERKEIEQKMVEERSIHTNPGDYLNNRNNVFHPMHYINGQKFMYVIMDRGVTTKVTTLNRVNSMRFLVFAGNNDGIIGYGKGKGADFEIALQKAFIDLKKNLVTLDIDESNTFPLKIQTKFSRFYVKMEPLKGFNCWGSPLFAAMIQLAGFHNLRFNLFSRQKNHYNLLYAFMKASCSSRSIPTIAESYGVRPFQLGLTKGMNTLAENYRYFVKKK